MKKIFITVFLFISTVCFSTTDFVNYYNKPQNWNSGKVGVGILVIKEKVVCSEDLILPDNIEIKIVENGELITQGEFSLTGNPDMPTELDPQKVYNKKIKAVISIINNLLLD